MKTLLFLLTVLPLCAWAQPDTLRPIRPEELKPIESELQPAYYGRYGTTVRSQYMYDGLDVRSPKELGKYILASGNGEAIREFQSYMSSRQTGTVFVVLGTGLSIGGLIAIISARSSPQSSNPFQGPPARKLVPVAQAACLSAFWEPV